MSVRAGAQELVDAYIFGSRDLSCPVGNAPERDYRVVYHVRNEEQLAALEYGEAQGWGYEVIDPGNTGRRGWAQFGPFDDSPNNRNNFDDTCPNEIYDSFIGAKNFSADCDATLGDSNTPCTVPEGLIFRIDVPNGSYRFVGAFGEANSRHAHRIVVENGGAGPSDQMSADHVVLVNNFDQAEHCPGTFARVGFGDRLPPVGEGNGPQFVNMDEDGYITAEAPSSPTLVVTEGYIRVHQLQGNSNAGACGDRDPNGGDMVLLELWGDCGDASCLSNEICDNEIDDDADGAVDCLDSDCPACPPEVCDNGIDDDRDEAIDCVDTDCPACPEICDNGVDDDRDEDIDCVDSDCPPCPEGLEAAFIFGSRNLSCRVGNRPDRDYTVVYHVRNEEQLAALAYGGEGGEQGWGYEIIDPGNTGRRGWEQFGPFDDSPNNRNAFDDTCPNEIYDSFIGGKNFSANCDETIGDRDTPCTVPEGLIFRIDVPNGSYRFVGAFGEAGNRHATRIVVENGGSGPPDQISDDHVVLVNNFDQAEHCAGTFARVGFEGLAPPVGEGNGPQFVNMDEDGYLTADAPSSPTLVVTEGYIRMHQLQGNSNPGACGDRDPNGGNVVLLELWKVADEVAGPPSYDLDFAGCDEVTGFAGNAFSTAVDLVLNDSNNNSESGAQSWSVGVVARGASITAITTEGTDAGGIIDNTGFQINELTSGDGNEGAISAVVVSFSTAASLSPNSSSSIATITVEGDMGAEDSTVDLAYREGLSGQGRPVVNVVTWEGATVSPSLGSCSFSVVPDVTPPAVPAGLSAVAGDGVVTLAWDDNTEDDFDFYNLSRDGAVIASVLIESSYTDETVENGITYSYSVTSVDAGGNESDSSAAVEATPEALGGSQKPGDYNEDAGVDISDAISVFGYLFLGREDPGCPAGLDFNGDSALDISDGIGLLNWLFQGGPGHALGFDCVQIIDCRDACN
jgi:hypothetical protein